MEKKTYEELERENQRLLAEHEELLRQREFKQEIQSCFRHDIKNAVAVFGMCKEIMSPLIDKSEYGEGNERTEACYLLRRYLKSFDSAGLKIANLSDVLRLSSLSKEDLKEFSKPFKPVRVIDEVIRSYEHHLIMKNQSGARFYFPRGLEYFSVNANVSAFTSIFSNMFSNAINYAFIPSVIQARLSVEENNLGIELENMVSKPIDAGEINYLFEKGYRKEDRGEILNKNEGLGLFFAQKAIKNGFGGELYVASGNTFQITSDRIEGFEERNYGFIPPSPFVGPLPSFNIKATIPFETCIAY